MDLQVVLPAESPTDEPADLARIARTAEQHGYHAVWLPDHLLPPDDYGDTYGGVPEPLVTLAFLAAHTRTIRLGTSVLVLPMRSPFVVAKQVATLDRLSAGRVTLGVGIGWDAAEFANVGVDFESRAARTDEAVALMRRLFGDGKSFEGAYYGFERGTFQPLPRRPVPIMTGGTSPPALRRAARLADEWQGLRLTPDEFGALAAELRDLAGRPIRTGTRIAWGGGETAFREAVASARDFAAAGADALAVWFGPVVGFEERMVRFAEAVRGTTSEG